jgi:hypothetical protein
MIIALITAGIFAGLFSARVHALARRSVESSFSSEVYTGDWTGAVGFFSFAALFVASFFLTLWWIPISAFLAASAAGGLAIGRGSFALHYAVRALYALVTLGCAVPIVLAAAGFLRLS